MFGFGKKKEEKVRELSSIEDLQKDDMVSFKHYGDLPLVLRGQTFTVSHVACYQYQSGLAPELTLSTGNNQEITLGYSDESLETMTLSLKIPREIVLSLFNEDDFGGLWDEGSFTTLTVTDHSNELLEGWLGEEYIQTAQEGVAFYFNSDVRADVISDRADDASEELRYHECLGGSNDEFGLVAEFNESGETEVFLCKYVPRTAIDDLWHGK